MAIHLAIYLTYNQETTFVDVVTANRTESRYSKTIASLARILTNRLSIKKEQTLKELLVETSHKLIENMQHQEGTGSSVSDFILTYMSVNAMNSIGNIEGCDCQIIQKSAKMKTLQYSGIVFFAIADKDVTTIKIGCKREEYNNADIIRIHDAIESVINLLSENPDIMVQDLKKIEGN